MRILIVGINFAPELTGIGKYTGEMVDWLLKSGHEVRVITAPPYYPHWKLDGAYRAGRYRTDRTDRSIVFRTPIWVPRKPNGAKRLLHLLSFALSSLPVLVFQLRWRPDVVWLAEPPLICAPAVVAFASLCRAKSWLHIQDFEVDAAFELGIFKGAHIRSCIARAECWLMKRFDRVSTISDGMLDLARTKGVSHERLARLPNWVNIGEIVPTQGPNPYRRALNLQDSAIVALYSGNMGNKQGLEVLAAVARILQHDLNVQFVFGGDGSGRSELEKRCAGLDNVRFVGLQPLSQLNDWLGFADLHLLPQRADAADLVMPSKLTGMLASGRAVVATANTDTELERIVAREARCGMVVPPEDPDAMANAIRILARDPALRSQMGSNGRVYAERELCREKVLQRFESCLYELVTAESR